GRGVIADLKLADVGDITALSLRRTAEAGADAVIVHGFVGIEGAPGTLAEGARELGVGLIVVAPMSHGGSTKYVGRHFEETVLDAIALGAEETGDGHEALDGKEGQGDRRTLAQNTFARHRGLWPAAGRDPLRGR
ncbi:MAG: orotidine 5'-phosphate decarboxylase / HUMPS family protein, partial [Desulfurococcaceae archaeon]